MHKNTLQNFYLPPLVYACGRPLSRLQLGIGLLTFSLLINGTNQRDVWGYVVHMCKVKSFVTAVHMRQTDRQTDRQTVVEICCHNIAVSRPNTFCVALHMSLCMTTFWSNVP